MTVTVLVSKPDYTMSVCASKELFKISAQVFNLGDYRREEAEKSKNNVYTNHAVFDPDNKEGRELRERICHKGLEDVLDWLQYDNGEVAVFDATNTTRERRKYLYNRVVIEKGIVLLIKYCVGN